MLKTKTSIHFPKFFDLENTNSKVENYLPSDRKFSLFLKLSLIIICLAMLGMSFFYGISGDEIDMNEYGKAILHYFTSFGADTTALNMPLQFDRDEVIKYYGGFFDLLCAIVNKISPLEEFTTRHLLNALVGFLGIYFTTKITQKLFNNPLAILAAWLMFLSPFFIGHAMNNPKDVPFATAYIMAIYFMIRFFERIDKLCFKDYLWLILSIGVAINIRVGGILLIPYLGVFAVMQFSIQKYQGEKITPIINYVKPLLIVSSMSYIAGSVFWPFGLQNPISNPIVALSRMSNFNIVVRQLFEGRRVLSDMLPLDFLPVSFAITNTFAVLIGLATCLLFILSFKKNKQFSTLLFVLFTAIFPLIYIIATHANVYHAWRHILFIFPSIIILSSFGWFKLFEKMKQFNVLAIAYAALGFALLEPLYFIVSTFPNTITYHNSMVGAVRGAYGKYEMDYYYNSLKETCDYFIKNEYPTLSQKDTIYVASNAEHIVAHYFKNYPLIKVEYARFLERNQHDWDYSVMHIALIPNSFLIEKKWLPPHPLYVAQSQGCALSAVYKRPSYHDVRAYNYLHENKFDSAITYFNYYLEKDPDNTCILNSKGKLLLQTAQMDSAIAVAKHSYQIDSTDPDTKLIYGITLIEQKNLTEAEKLFKTVINDFPDDKETYFYLGLVQKDLGKHEEALSNFDISANSEQYRPSALKMMGDIYMEQGKQEEAVKLYKAGGFLK